jgi:hypothetical protein
MMSCTYDITSQLQYSVHERNNSQLTASSSSSNAPPVSPILQRLGALMLVLSGARPKGGTWPRFSNILCGASVQVLAQLHATGCRTHLRNASRSRVGPRCCLSSLQRLRLDGRVVRLCCMRCQSGDRLWSELEELSYVWASEAYALCACIWTCPLTYSLTTLRIGRGTEGDGRHEFQNGILSVPRIYYVRPSHPPTVRLA